MTLSQILRVLRARWRAALLVLATVVALAVALTTVLTPQYTATASVVLDVKSTDPIVGSAMQPLAISGYMATQADVIVSERVIAGALRSLKIDIDPETVTKWKTEASGRGDLLSWLTDQTLKRFEVLPSRESNVITVSYTSPSPERSAALLNAVVKSYIATTIELRTEPAKQYNGFFDDRAKELRGSLEQAQERLSAYQRNAGVVASDERLDVENSRLSELSSQLVLAQSAAGESSSRNALNTGRTGSTQEVLASPLISTLTTDLARQQARFNELTARLGDGHPDVQTLRANIVELQSQIATETRKILGSVSVNNNVSEIKVTQLRAALDAQRNKVLQLKAQRDQASVLQRDVENANQAYSAAFSRVSQSNLESQATQTNVSILKMATPPANPSKPRTVLNIAVALVLGSLLGISVAIIREIRDQRLRTEDDVTELLRQPLFGVLPNTATAHSSKALDLGATARRLLGGSPASASL